VVGGPPRPLRNLEDQDEGRHEALQDRPTRDKLGREGEVVEILTLVVVDRISYTPGRQADVRVGEEQPLASGRLGTEVERVILAQPAFW
jgi:hypothetical protein